MEADRRTIIVEGNGGSTCDACTTAVVASAAAMTAEDASMLEDGARTAYSSFWPEDADDTGQVRWLGRILVCTVAGRALYIGPHWYCSIIMFGFIFGVGGFYVNSALQAGSVSQIVGGVVVTVTTLITFLRCALSDPGVLQRKPGLVQGDASMVDHGQIEHFSEAATPSFNGSSQRLSRHCNKCNVMQPRGCSHCEYCQVCVVGYDHHCPWMGKCIGAKNVCAFYTFIVVAFTSLGYIFVMTVLDTPTPGTRRPSP